MLILYIREVGGGVGVYFFCKKKTKKKDFIEKGPQKPHSIK